MGEISGNGDQEISPDSLDMETVRAVGTFLTCPGQEGYTVPTIGQYQMWLAARIYENGSPEEDVVREALQNPKATVGYAQGRRRMLNHRLRKLRQQGNMRDSAEAREVAFQYLQYDTFCRFAVIELNREGYEPVLECDS